MIGATFWLVWAIGAVLSIYPIHRAILLGIARDNASDKGGRTNTSPGTFWTSLGLGTVISLVWFLAIPGIVSYFIYNRKIPNTLHDSIQADHHIAAEKIIRTNVERELKALGRSDDQDTIDEWMESVRAKQLPIGRKQVPPSYPRTPKDSRDW